MKKLKHFFIVLTFLSWLYPNIDYVQNTLINVDDVEKIQINDLDNDGDFDIIFTDQDFRFGWYENIGLYEYTYHSIANAYDGPSDINIVDLDHDGDKDILISVEYGLNGAVGVPNEFLIAWFENDGLENFTQNSEELGKKIFKFCKLTWSEDTLNFYKRKNLYSKTLSFKQIRSKISLYDKKRYKHYFHLLDPYKNKYEWLDIN